MQKLAWAPLTLFGTQKWSCCHFGRRNAPGSPLWASVSCLAGCLHSYTLFQSLKNFPFLSGWALPKCWVALPSLGLYEEFHFCQNGFKVKLSEVQPVCHELVLSYVLIPVQSLGTGFELRHELRVRSQPSPWMTWGHDNACVCDFNSWSKNNVAGQLFVTDSRFLINPLFFPVIVMSMFNNLWNTCPCGTEYGNITQYNAGV